VQNWDWKRTSGVSGLHWLLWCSPLPQKSQIVGWKLSAFRAVEKVPGVVFVAAGFSLAWTKTSLSSGDLFHRIG
jgi:hypothetical protein